MIKIMKLKPYESIGNLVFGMTRNEVKNYLGECRSTYMYGYPVEDRFLDNYGDMHALFNNQQLLEAVEIFPDLQEDELWIELENIKMQIYIDKIMFLNEIKIIAPDITLDSEGDGYFSDKLGLKVYCPEDKIEDIIVHDRYCYDEGNQYLEENGFK